MQTELGQLVAANLAQIRSNAADLAAPLQASGAAPQASSNSFADRMQAAIQSVNDQDHGAGQRMAAVDSGQSDDLVGAMLASQQAGLSFSMLMQVRNKVMSAVEDLVKLPI